MSWAYHRYTDLTEFTGLQWQGHGPQAKCISHYCVTNGSPTEKPRLELEPEPELELVPVTHKPKPKPKPKAHTNMDSDSYLNVEGNTNTMVALEKADKGKGKVIDLPEDLYEGPTLKICSIFFTL